MGETVEQRHLSQLFKALNRGEGAGRRKYIHELLSQGAIIQNGNILAPDKLPKLLTQYANAGNVRKTLSVFRQHYRKPLEGEIFLEVGAGSGYLKYLLFINNDPLASSIMQRLVETEVSDEIVSRNLHYGKHTIPVGITDLVHHFGEALFAGVISLNVMDTFSENTLTQYMKIIHRLVKTGGIFLHIMSSSVHVDVFRDIQQSYPAKLTLPYFRNGNVGVRIVSPGDVMGLITHPEIVKPEGLAALFAQNPQLFITQATRFSDHFQRTGKTGLTILLKDYFRQKITNAFEKVGFKGIFDDEITSRQQVPCNTYHQKIPEVNYFENRLGALFTHHVQIPGLKSGHVVERSIFYVIMGRKV